MGGGEVDGSMDGIIIAKGEESGDLLAGSFGSNVVCAGPRLPGHSPGVTA